MKLLWENCEKNIPDFSFNKRDLNIDKPEYVIANQNIY